MSWGFGLGWGCVQLVGKRWPEGAQGKSVSGLASPLLLLVLLVLFFSIVAVVVVYTV